MREYFPTIYETIGTSISSTKKKEEDNILTMRNTLKYYENKVNFKLK